MAHTIIDVNRLQRDLHSERSNLQSWTEDRVTSARDTSDGHFKAVDEQAAILEELEQQRAELHERAVELQGRMADEAAFVQELQRRLGEARGTETALPDEIDKLQTELQHEFNRVQMREAELSKQNAKSLENLEQLQSQVDIFKSRLGLRLERPENTDGDLKWVFTSVDEADPTREFSIGMRVNDAPVGGNVYQVGVCHPPVPELPDYLQELNDSKNLSLFVRKLRRAFKTMVAAEGMKEMTVS